MRSPVNNRGGADEKKKQVADALWFSVYVYLQLISFRSSLFVRQSFKQSGSRCTRQALSSITANHSLSRSFLHSLIGCLGLRGGRMSAARQAAVTWVFCLEHLMGQRGLSPGAGQSSTGRLPVLLLTFCHTHSCYIAVINVTNWVVMLLTVKCIVEMK